MSPIRLVMRGVVCVLGHTRQAMECPACAEEAGDVPSLEHWRWYRNRTSSKRVKAAVDVILAVRGRRAPAPPPKDPEAAADVEGAA